MQRAPGAQRTESRRYIGSKLRGWHGSSCALEECVYAGFTRRDAPRRVCKALCARDPELRTPMLPFQSQDHYLSLRGQNDARSALFDEPLARTSVLQMALAPSDIRPLGRMAASAARARRLGAPGGPPEGRRRQI